MKEIAGNVIHFQAEEIADLRAGDQDRNAVSEADDDGARKVFHHTAHARHAEQHQQHARHHGARE